MEKLSDYSLESDPLISFKSWFAKAQELEQNPEAMTLATLDLKLNRPAARTVLFKGFSAKNQMTFYTNYQSQKGHELEFNDEACLVFYWHVSKKQVRIHGKVKKMDQADSEKYFHLRPRDSQLASYISEQSSPIKDKTALLEKLKIIDQKFTNETIPLPSSWGGYLFTPYEFEFFLYGDFRLNDRFLYTLKGHSWDVMRLQP